MPGNEVGDVGMGVEWSWRGSSGGEISCHSSGKLLAQSKQKMQALGLKSPWAAARLRQTVQAKRRRKDLETTEEMKVTR